MQRVKVLHLDLKLPDKLIPQPNSSPDAAQFSFKLKRNRSVWVDPALIFDLQYMVPENKEEAVLAWLKHYLAYLQTNCRINEAYTTERNGQEVSFFIMTSAGRLERRPVPTPIIASLICKGNWCLFLATHLNGFDFWKASAFGQSTAHIIREFHLQSLEYMCNIADSAKWGPEPVKNQEMKKWLIQKKQFRHYSNSEVFNSWFPTMGSFASETSIQWDFLDDGTCRYNMSKYGGYSGYWGDTSTVHRGRPDVRLPFDVFDCEDKSYICLQYHDGFNTLHTVGTNWEKLVIDGREENTQYKS